MTSTAFKFVTSNMQGTDSSADIRETVLGVVKESGAVVAAWQEAPDNDIALLGSLGSKWTNIAGSEVPISYRNDLFRLLGSKLTRVHGGEKHVTPSRYIHQVDLEDRKTGLQFSVINTHVVHHIDGKGHPLKYKGSEIKKYAKQPARAVLHFHMLRDLIWAAAKVRPVIWAGDLNVDFEDDKRVKYPKFPYVLLSRITKFAIPTGPTEGGRTIDWTGYSGDGITLTAAATRKGKINSDHSPVVTGFQLAGTGNSKPVNRGSRIEAAIKSLKTANRPSQKSKTDAALALLESIPGLK